MAMIGDTRKNWYWSDFNTGISPFNIRVAVVDITTVQREVPNATIAILRYSAPTLTVIGHSFNYGHMWFSLQQHVTKLSLMGSISLYNSTNGYLYGSYGTNRYSSCF
jgi:hypothetical protein